MRQQYKSSRKYKRSLLLLKRFRQLSSRYVFYKRNCGDCFNAQYHDIRLFLKKNSQ